MRNKQKLKTAETDGFNDLFYFSLMLKAVVTNPVVFRINLFLLKPQFIVNKALCSEVIPL